MSIVKRQKQKQDEKQQRELAKMCLALAHLMLNLAKDARGNNWDSEKLCSELEDQANTMMNGLSDLLPVEA